MNPSNPIESSGFNVQPPKYETAGTLPVQTPENNSGIEHLHVQSPSAQPVMNQNTQTVPPAFKANPYTNTGMTYSQANSNLMWQTVSDDPKQASESKRIEKPWVMKVKQVITSTKNDPFIETESIMRLRADYIKKRYNKDIKLTNE